MSRCPQADTHPNTSPLIRQPCASPEAPPPARAARVQPTPQDQAKARAILAALGGPANLREVTANASRLRIVLANPASLDQTALAKAGARGCVTLNDGVVHLVVGPGAEALEGAMRSNL